MIILFKGGRQRIDYLHSTADYSVEFRILAESGWDDLALQRASVRNYDDDELGARDEANNLDMFISLSIQINNTLQERERDLAVVLVLLVSVFLEKSPMVIPTVGFLPVSHSVLYLQPLLGSPCN